MKALKIVLILLFLVVIIVIGGGYFLFSNMEKVVKYAVETAGPKVTQTAVTLDGVALDLPKGEAELNGFMIGNPEGYDSSHLFDLGKLSVNIDTTTLSDNVIVIEDLTIEGIDILVEQKGTTTNVQQLMKNMNSGGGSAEAESETTEGGSEKTFMIEKLRFAEGSMRLITEKYGEKAVAMPAFEVKNIGSKTDGLTTEELGKAVLAPLLKQARKATEKALQSEARKKLEGKLKDKIESNEQLNKAKEKLKGLF